MTDTTIIKQYLQELNLRQSSNEKDEKVIRGILKFLGFDKVIITYGVVYLDGVGTIENPPMSIQQIAKFILNSLNKLDTIKD